MANDIANLLANAAQTNANWKGLGDLGQAIQQGRVDQMRREAIQQYGAGDPSALLKSGDLALATLYMQDRGQRTGDARDTRDYGFRVQEAARQQANADRGYGLQERKQTQAEDKTPEGFRANPAAPDALEAIPGGPKDPAYIRDTIKPQRMSVTDVSKLSEEGNKLSQLQTFSDTFKPEFAGHTLTGSLPNVLGRNLPEAVVGSTVAQGAGWWQAYDKYRNVVRHELFGSALTPGEKAAFEQADVNPRMDPAQIMRNMAVQKTITERAVSRKANALIEQGYNPDTVSKAYGIKFQGRVGAPAANAAPANPGAVSDAGVAGGPSPIDWRSYFGGSK